ncbi:cation-transporting P-type ATPase [Nonomuraea sp. NPDC005983]|uniref:cation-transporting P-type ATPase n=1 Tax=Nonomuraea sp. NPDC005983 TaxID=3155595 RepID=UPI0033A2EEF0
MVWAPEAPAAASLKARPDRLADVAELARLEVLRRLGSAPRGLVESQAEERLLLHGENTIIARRPPSWPRRLARIRCGWRRARWRPSACCCRPRRRPARSA